MERTTKIALTTVSAVVGIVLAYSVLLIYLTWPISSVSIDKAGVFGDSFGILTSIFSGLAFAGVIWTVLTQLEELGITRDQLKNQGIENAFFQMLSLHNQILNDIDLIERNGAAVIRTYGRDVIKVFNERLHRRYANINIPGNKSSEFDKANQAYSEFWEDSKSELAHYFRFLYNLIRFVDNSESDKKELYVALVRAQLSNQELALLFYNCLSSQGSAFSKYAEKYNLFDNLIDADLMAPNHISLMSEKAIGKNLNKV